MPSSSTSPGCAGAVFVGSSFDTPAFAADCIEKWWRTEGRGRRYQRTGKPSQFEMGTAAQ